jgi:hypothetical protein
MLVTLLADGFAPGKHARLCPAPVALLAVPRRHAAGLCDSDPAREDLVYSQVWRIMGETGRVKACTLHCHRVIPSAFCMSGERRIGLQKAGIGSPPCFTGLARIAGMLLLAGHLRFF